MTVTTWLELSNDQAGLFQLAGTPNTNYNSLLYAKALLARREGKTIFFIDNHGIIDSEKLQQDLNHEPELIKGFYVFTPKNLPEFLSLVDDLELLYFTSVDQPLICISGIFEFLIKNPTNHKNLTLMVHLLGLLESYNLPVFVTNEMRATGEFDLPFLSFLVPTFFSKVFIIELHGKELSILNYTF